MQPARLPLLVLLLCSFFGILPPERLLLLGFFLLCRSELLLLFRTLGFTGRRYSCGLGLLIATLFNADLGEPIDRALVLESGRGTQAMGASNLDAFDDSEQAG